MGSKSDFLLDYFKAHKPHLEHNAKIFDIMEGELGKYVKAALDEQFTGNSAAIAEQRMVPINCMRKIVQKLSKLYQAPPKRTFDSSSDQELADYYAEEKGLNIELSDCNEAFNAYKACNLEFYEDSSLDNNPLQFRSLPGHVYLPLSLDPVDATRYTHMIKVIYSKDTKLWVYSEDDFSAYDEHGKVVGEDMPAGGENPFGIVPFSYMARSRHLLIPKNDSDFVKLTIHIPVLLTDLAFSSMFLSNPVLFTIDSEVENLKLSPNTFWNIKSDSFDDGKKAQVGVLKPEPNIEAQLSLIKETLGMWLQSKNIRPGTIGKMSGESATSGISLVIMDADTTEDRKIQQRYFETYEQDVFYRLATIHNKLVDMGRITGQPKFSNPEDLKMTVEFAPQEPIESKSEQVERLSKEIQAGINSKEGAIKEYRPSLSEDDIQEIINQAKPVVNVRFDDGNEAPEIQRQD